MHALLRFKILVRLKNAILSTCSVFVEFVERHLKAVDLLAAKRCRVHSFAHVSPFTLTDALFGGAGLYYFLFLSVVAIM